MKPRGILAGLLAFLAAGTLGAQDQPTFELGFAGGDCGQTVESSAGGSAYLAKPVDLDCTLTTADNPSDADGAQGWSLSIGVEGLEVVDITTAGTVGADVGDDPPGLRSGGFEKSEVTTGEDNAGAVSAVVLSFTEPITLEPEGTETVAKLTVQGGAFPDTIGESTTVRAFYVDGRQGSGQPVQNAVTWTGQTIDPTLGECAVELATVEAPPICPNPDAGLQMILQTEATGQSDELFAGQAPTPDAEQPAQIEVAPGQATVYGAIVSNGLETGVQGWSLAASVGDGVTLAAATTDGTVGADVTGDPPGLRSGGFEKTELIDPALNDQGQGAVSAVVLSFTEPIELETTGTATVLALTLEGELDDAAVIGWQDGLQGSGQPVQNVATVGGGTEAYSCQQRGEVVFAAPPTKFIRRGESNGDGRIDLADAVYIINWLFREGPGPSCAATADANSDGMSDSSDALFILNYLWLGGPMPTGATGECEEVDPGVVDCETDTPGCV